MGQIEDLRLFAHVIENHSISRAAEKMHIAKSAVSRRLSLLEERYGTRLIDRSPGVWDITATGRELYQRATRIVGDIDEIEDDFVNASADLTGPLSVSVPREFGISFLNASLIAFKERHPEILLTVDFDDRTVDLARENYDFAIRITSETQSDVSALRIGTVQHRLFASAAYLTAHDEPRCLSDLHDHPLLHFGAARRSAWEFIGENGKLEAIEFQPALNSNSGVFLLDSVLNGLGIARLPGFIAQSAVATGKLRPILEKLTTPDRGIFMVHSDNRRLDRRMRLFFEEMKFACASNGH
jgi:DNA-binding transcriptional LysR family regulator